MEIKKADSKGRVSGFEPTTFYRVDVDSAGVITLTPVKYFTEAELQGHWSNGDPTHIITDGVNRKVAPNLNGAEWVVAE